MLRLAKRKYTKLAPKSSGTFVYKTFTQEAARTLESARLLAKTHHSLKSPLCSCVSITYQPDRKRESRHRVSGCDPCDENVTETSLICSEESREEFKRVVYIYIALAKPRTV